MLTYIFNASISLQHISKYLKAAEIIMIQKPGKPPQQRNHTDRFSCSQLLPNCLEKILLKRIKLHVEVLNFQFGFWPQHAPAEQIHRGRREHRMSSRRKKVMYCNLHLRGASLWQGLAWRSYLQNETHALKESVQADGILPLWKDLQSCSWWGKIRLPPNGSKRAAEKRTWPPPVPATHTAGTEVAIFADDVAITAVSESRPIATYIL